MWSLSDEALVAGLAAGRDRDHVAIAVAMALERSFGGWVPPAPAASAAYVPATGG